MVALSKPPRPELKGRPPLRKCPDDFDVIFVEQGRLGCEAWYRARRSTVDRWLRERGKQRLINERAAYVSSQRKAGNWLTRSSSLVEIRKVKPKRTDAIRDRRRVNPTLARHAAQYIRIARNGGFIVSMANNGDWRVGTRSLSAAQLLDFAVSKGFDRTINHEAVTPVSRFVSSSFSADHRAVYHDDFKQRWLHQNGNAEYRLGSTWRDDDDDPLPDLRGVGPDEVE